MEENGPAKVTDLETLGAVANWLAIHRNVVAIDYFFVKMAYVAAISVAVGIVVVMENGV